MFFFSYFVCTIFIIGSLEIFFRIVIFRKVWISYQKINILQKIKIWAGKMGLRDWNSSMSRFIFKQVLEEIIREIIAFFRNVSTMIIRLH